MIAWQRVHVFVHKESFHASWVELCRIPILMPNQQISFGFSVVLQALQSQV
jgi:hypothetical protein